MPPTGEASTSRWQIYEVDAMKHRRLAIFAILFSLLVLVHVRPSPTDVVHSVCAVKVWREDVEEYSIYGSGVILDTGYVLTNMHVVDVNRDGVISDAEKDVVLKLYNGEDVDATVVRYGAFELPDIAILYAKGKKLKSSARLATEKDLKRMRFGDPVFGVGFPASEFPSHIVSGVLSLSQSDFIRTSTPIYFGNSGGGLFLASNNLLIGINTRVRVDRGTIVPSWSESVSAKTIRDFVGADTYIVDKKKNTLLILSIITCIGVTLYAFRRHLL